jgi:hypothetical protein
VCGAGTLATSIDEPLPPQPVRTSSLAWESNGGWPPPPPEALSCTGNNLSNGAKSSKAKKMMYDLTENDEFDREEIVTYEEVARLFPRPGTFRPIVLIGPPGVGRNELKRRLISLDQDRYRTTIPRKKRTFLLS